MCFKATILTLFPDMFPGPLGQSVMGRALDAQLWSLITINMRDYAIDKHNTVDDTPYGGGAGMVMRPDVVASSIREAKRVNPSAPTIFLAPVGKRLQQDKVKHFATLPGINVLCGHYEGIDQRVIDSEVDDVISIGDYVLSGGEIPAMVLLDAVLRHVPGVLGADSSLHEESFDFKGEDGQPLLEYPHFTRPAEWEGHKVPDVLLSGNHAAIRQWRLEQAKARTQARTEKL